MPSEILLRRLPYNSQSGIQMHILYAVTLL